MIRTKVVKKNNSIQDWNDDKIISAVTKSAERANTSLSDSDKSKLISIISNSLSGKEYVNVSELHNIVEQSLYKINETVAKSYIEYRNYKLQFVKMMDEVYRKKLELNDVRDNSHANAASSLVTTQKAITYSELNGELYKRFFLTDEEREAVNDGYIYIHDKGARLDCTNCCLFDMKTVLSGGFDMGNMHYNEPKSIDVAFSVMTDIIFNAGSSQYGGFTVSEVDKLLSPYAKKSYDKYFSEYLKLTNNAEQAEEYSMRRLTREIEQHVQAMEMKLNSCETSRGDYIFTSISFGLSSDKFGQLISSIILKVRKEGQGREGYKRPVLFPKLTFLYDENVHGNGKELEWLFLEAVDCTMKAQYPDFLSMSGDGYAPSIYKKYGVTISRMGAVSGDSLLIFLHNSVIKVLPIKDAYDYFSKLFHEKDQSDFGYVKDNKYIELEGVKVYDADGFVNCTRLIKNYVGNEFYEIRFSNGRRGLFTHDHPWSIEGRLVNTENLCVGMKVQSYNKIELGSNIFTNTNVDLAYLEGLFLCDGSYKTTPVLYFGMDELDIINKVKSISKKLFGYIPDLKEMHRGVKGDYIEVKFKLKNNPHSDLMRSFREKMKSDFVEFHKEQRRIPEWIFNSDKETKLAFIAGMIDADGYINSYSKNCSSVEIGLKNKEVILQLLALLHSLGYDAIYSNGHHRGKNIQKLRHYLYFKFIKELKNFMSSGKKINHVKDFALPNNDEMKEITVKEIVRRYDLDSELSYDVSTSSEYFYCSGIRSHNCRANLSPWYEVGGQEPADDLYEVEYTDGTKEIFKKGTLLENGKLIEELL